MLLPHDPICAGQNSGVDIESNNIARMQMVIQLRDIEREGDLLH